MADSEGTETAQIEDVSKSCEKEQAEPINEEQATVQQEEEAQKANENGHQTDEPASEGESKTEEPPKDNVDAKPTEEAASEVTKDEDIAMSSENGSQISDKKETTEDKPSEVKTEQPKEENEGLASTVSKFYNEHKENTREERKTSPIFYLRNFNNWVKSVLINEFMEKYKRKTFRNLSVLDLACGKGGDLLKWQKARISNLVCADIAEVSIKQCEQRYKDMRYGRNQRRYNQPQRIFDAQFITADCTKENISDQFNSRNSDVQFDMTSCQFSLHYAFESPEQAEKMLENACGRLKPGGYFIGTIPCANEIINRLRQSEDMSFENDCYKITFTEKENFSLFGHKYDFHLEGVVDCPEFLVYFPLLEKMAKKYDLTLELAQGFHHFFEDHKDKDDYRFLLNRMNALETFPPRREGDKPVSDKEDAYTQAKEILGEEDDSDYRQYVGTLSKDEWEAAGLYMAFAFKKAEEPKPTPVEEFKTDVNETEQSIQQSGEKDGDMAGEDKKDEQKMEEDHKVEELGTATKIDEGDKNEEKAEGAEEKGEGVDEKGEGVDEKGEGVDEKGEGVDEKGEGVDEKGEGAEEKGEGADEKGEGAEEKAEGADEKAEGVEEKAEGSKDSDEKDDDSDNKSEDAAMKDEDVDKKDESGDKNDDDLDKKDQVGGKVESEENASTDVFQESEAGKQEDGGEEKKSTPLRGRRKRSAGAAKDEVGTLEVGAETTPKRGTRKRKPTSGSGAEPPEKKKA